MTETDLKVGRRKIVFTSIGKGDPLSFLRRSRAPLFESSSHWQMARTCEIRLLGGFQVEVDGSPVPAEAWRHRRAADLVNLLAQQTGHTLHRGQVVELLWPDLDPELGG